MFDVDFYLRKLGYSGPREPSLTLLNELQKRHLMTIPFDNSLNADAERGFDVLLEVEIDDDAVFKAVVEGGRGGVCYELNGLFRRLLTELGFHVRILAAAVIQVNGTYGPELEHIFNCVELGGERYLVDVGLAGPSYLEPLRVTDEIQEQYGCQYRLVEEDGYQVLQRRAKGGDWSPSYRFEDRYRQISDWGRLVPGIADFPLEQVLIGTRIHSRAFENGQMVLIGKRYLRVEDGVEEIKVLTSPSAFKQVVRQILTPGA
ncbi:arylamine N-acetyltransferase family protein [Streptomyces cyanogenus]|uniref:Proansamycin X synthase n=1 Tax=Streptomyces cyanogenus TaxID=80860 RepID=A0ABX7TKM5_STRCY|nr:arylamine N-acetyltransferase [Streptomyces cyanogenus]QTD95925.1 Proansamycin X synthase [Streptomyces cyanogenus]